MRRVKRLIGVILSIIMISTFIYGCGNDKSKAEEIIVYSLYRDDIIVNLVNMYNNKNDDVQLKYDYSISQNRDISVSDAIKILNTELLSGKGPDILFLDELNVDTYMKKGILEDISEEVNKSKNSLYKNVYDSYCTEDNKIYSFPINMVLPIMVRKGKDKSEINDLKSLTTEIERLNNEGESNIFPMLHPKELINLLYYSCKDSWINKDKTFNEKNFEEFLVSSKKIYDIGTKTIEDATKRKLEEEFNYAVSCNKEVQWYSDNKMNCSYIKNIVGYESKLVLGCMISSDDFSMLEGIKESEDISFNFWNGQVDSYFIPQYLLGINKNSKYKDKAKSFISFALDKETQNSVIFPFMSTNKDVFINKVNENAIKEGQEIMGGFCLYDENGNEIDLEYASLNADEIKDYILKIEDIQNNVSTDITILNLIIDDIERYILGELSLEESVKISKDKVEIYLSE